MKKRSIVTLCILILMTYSVFADAGLSINNDAKADLDAGSLNESFYAIAWAEAGIPEISLNIIGRIGTSISIDPSAEESTNSVQAPVYTLIDMDKFSLSGELDGYYGPNVKYEVGRFQLRDFTGYVLNHKADGLSYTFSFTNLSLKFETAYTGLLWKSSAGLTSSKSDLFFSSDPEQFNASPRVLGNVQLSIPAGSFMINTAVLFQEDMSGYFEEKEPLSAGEKEFSNALGGLLDTQYIGGGFSGSLPGQWSLNLGGFYNSGRTLNYIFDAVDPQNSQYSYSDIQAFIISGGVKKGMPSFMGSNLGLDIVYTSGDADSIIFTEGNTEGKSKQYVAISRSSFGEVFSPQLGNLIVAKLNGSVKPISSGKMKELQIGINEFNFFRPTAAPISEPGVDPDSALPYLGSEVDIFANFRPYSDLGVSVSGGVFIPSAAFDANLIIEKPMETSLKVFVSFSI